MRDGERERERRCNDERGFPSFLRLPVCTSGLCPSGAASFRSRCPRCPCLSNFRPRPLSPFFHSSREQCVFPPEMSVFSNVSVSSDFALRARAKLGIKGRKITGTDRGMTMIFLYLRKSKFKLRLTLCIFFSFFSSIPHSFAFFPLRFFIFFP